MPPSTIWKRFCATKASESVELSRFEISTLMPCALKYPISEAMNVAADAIDNTWPTWMTFSCADALPAPFATNPASSRLDSMHFIAGRCIDSPAALQLAVLVLELE